MINLRICFSPNHDNFQNGLNIIHSIHSAISLISYIRHRVCQGFLSAVKKSACPAKNSGGDKNIRQKAKKNLTGCNPRLKTRAICEIRGYNTGIMKLPKLQNSEKYVVLYIFDFGDHVGVGFTAQEVAELLESEKYKDSKVYKIHKAYPDGKLELKGIRAEIFQLEAGMFFYSGQLETAKRDFKALGNLAVKSTPPCRAKTHLAKYTDHKFVVALIYPAEYDDQVSSWLLDGRYKTSGAAEGGTEAVQRYYDHKPQILERHQLFGKSESISRTGQELLAGIKLAVQR